MKQQVKLFILPVLFGSLAVALSIWLLCFTDEQFTGTLLPELIGFALEGLVFIGLFTAYQKRKDQKQKAEMRATAYRTLYMPIYKYANVLFSMHKATSVVAGECQKVSVSSFLSSLNVENMGHIYMGNDAPVVPTARQKITWCDYIQATTLDLTQSVEKVLDRYGWNLSAKDVETLEAIASNQLINSLKGISEVAHGYSSMPIESAQGSWTVMFMTHPEGPQFSHFQQWVNLLAELAKRVDGSHDEVKEDLYLNWQTNVSPSLGQELPIQKKQAAQ